MPLHLVLVHFPVGLLVVGAIVDLVGTLAGREGTRRWAGAMLMIGAAAALLAFLSGENALLTLGREIETQQRVEVHTQWAGVGIWLLMIAGGLRAAWRNRLDGAQKWITLGMAVLSALLVLGISLSGTAINHSS